MPLDPVHVNGIAELAGAIARRVDDGDPDDLAATVWAEFLDPLTHDGRIVVEPIEEPRLRAAPIDEAALVEPPFDVVHGLDSGTINPTAFTNGLVVDVAQAAMAADPSDLDVHRQRSLVATVHANDVTVDFTTDWVHYDEGYSRRKVIHAPRVNRFAEGVVHALALYLAESEHALVNAHLVPEFLLLDGPIYPKELLNWQDRDAELSALAREAQPRQVLANYVELVERFGERDVPIAGFVKSPSSKLITRTVREKGLEAPWVDDAALFRRLLERPTDGADEGATPDGRGDARHSDAASGNGAGAVGRATDRLTFTSWFRSRGGADRAMAADGDALGVDRALDPEEYEVTFFVVFEPREGVVFRVEAPYGATRDPDVRDRITRQVLRGVAARRGPPEAVAKADALARISAAEKAAIRERFEERFDADSLRTYDDVRWDGEDG
jgi:hypothetical protein